MGIEVLKCLDDFTCKVFYRPSKMISLNVTSTCSFLDILIVRAGEGWLISRPVTWKIFNFNMSHDMTKPTKWVCTQRRLIILGECPGWSESSLGAQSFCLFCHVAAQLYMYSYMFKVRINHKLRSVLTKTQTCTLNIYVYILFGFYGLSTLFHSFLAESIVRWGENGRPLRKTTWPPVNRVWLVSHITQSSLEPTALRWQAI